MPDPSRQPTFSRLNRLLAHVLVVGLVVTTAGVGILATRAVVPDVPGVPAPDRQPLAFEIVGSARAAGAVRPASLRSLSVELVPEPDASDPLLNLRMPAPTPEPTPDPTPAPRPQPVAARPAPPPPVVGSGGLAWPVPGGTVTQYYHAGHLALDIATQPGRPVVAAASGVVTWAGWRSNGGGMVIVIDHGNGMQTGYNHLGSLWVSAGQHVAVGQGIAGVGCTGMCTGPHVHFQVIVGGILVNPLRYL